MMVGLPKLPLAEAVPLRLALSIASDVLVRARRELGETVDTVQDVDAVDLSRQQWGLALEGVQERIEGLRRLVSAE
jgi:hypothetical protein